MPQEKELQSAVLNETFEEPQIQIVKLEGVPITADSDRCFWHSES